MSHYPCFNPSPCPINPEELVGKITEQTKSWFKTDLTVLKDRMINASMAHELIFTVHQKQDLNGLVLEGSLTIGSRYITFHMQLGKMIVSDPYNLLAKQKA